MHLRTSSYHPALNGMVERFHRQLNQQLPIILLGIRSSWKEDVKVTPAELLLLPGELISPKSSINDSNKYLTMFN